MEEDEEVVDLDLDDIKECLGSQHVDDYVDGAVQRMSQLQIEAPATSQPPNLASSHSLPPINIDNTNRVSRGPNRDSDRTMTEKNFQAEEVEGDQAMLANEEQSRIEGAGEEITINIDDEEGGRP